MGKGKQGCGRTAYQVDPTFIPDGGVGLLDPSDARPIDYNSRELNYEYVQDQAGLAACVQALRHPDVTRVGLDIETTGTTRPWQGTIRTIQVAVEEPEPRQWVIDVWHVPPGELLDVLADPEVEIVTCNGKYEQLHIMYRYGVEITNIYDVCFVSRVIGSAKKDEARSRLMARLAAVKARHQRSIKEAKEQIRAAKAALRKATTDEEEQAASQALTDAEAALQDAKEAQLSALEEAKVNAPKLRKMRHDYQALMRRYVNKKISKAQQTSEWDAEELSIHQLKYGALDAAGLLDIRRGIAADIAARGLEAEAHAANQGIPDKVRDQIEMYGDTRHDQVERMLRAFAHAQSFEELEEFRSLLGRITLYAPHRSKLADAYQERKRALSRKSR